MSVIWKEIPSLPGWLAGSDGSVLMPPRIAPLPNGGFRTYLTEPTFGSKKRAKTGAKHVYMGVWSRHAGNVKVHQAICEAFHGPKPFPEAVVIHIDEDGTNNNPANLKWGTQKENLNAPGFRAIVSERSKMQHRVKGSGTKGGFARSVAA